MVNEKQTEKNCVLLLFDQKLKWLKQVSLFVPFFGSSAVLRWMDGRTCVSKCITFLDGQWHVIINII